MPAGIQTTSSSGECHQAGSTRRCNLWLVYQSNGNKTQSKSWNYGAAYIRRLSNGAIGFWAEICQNALRTTTVSHNKEVESGPLGVSGDSFCPGKKLSNAKQSRQLGVRNLIKHTRQEIITINRGFSKDNNKFLGLWSWDRLSSTLPTKTQTHLLYCNALTHFSSRCHKIGKTVWWLFFFLFSSPFIALTNINQPHMRRTRQQKHDNVLLTLLKFYYSISGLWN